jgi:hypothetical protein
MNDILKSAIAAVDAALAPEGQVQHPGPYFADHPRVRQIDAVAAKAASDAEIDALLTERGGVHGDFTVGATTAQALKAVMRDTPNWTSLTTVQMEALEHIATKIARILSGNPNHKDHYSDIQGYARLVELRLP